MKKHLVIHLDAPVMSFGGPSVDRVGLTGAFPGNSLLTGLAGNALGYKRRDHRRLQSLQDRMFAAARIDREPPHGATLLDFQTVNLGAGADSGYQKGQWTVGWTTRGRPETRAGDQRNYEGSQGQNRLREYRADTKITIALRLEPEDTGPTLEQVADALDQPFRILYIGRKPCTPSARLCGGFVHADTALEAVLSVPLDPGGGGALSPYVRVQWEDEDSPDRSAGPAAELRDLRQTQATDLKNWRAGVHGGSRILWTATVPRTTLPHSRTEEQIPA